MMMEKDLIELVQDTLDFNEENFPGWEWQKLAGGLTHEEHEQIINDLMHMYWTGCIAGEAGEIANMAKKYIRYVLGWSGKKLTWEEYKEGVEIEIGDVLIYLILYCKILGTDLTTILNRCLEKNYERFKYLKEHPRIG